MAIPRPQPLVTGLMTGTCCGGRVDLSYRSFSLCVSFRLVKKQVSFGRTCRNWPGSRACSNTEAFTSTRCLHVQVTRPQSLWIQTSSAWAALESAKQPSGSCASIFAVSGDFDSTDERVPVTAGTLNDPFSSCRKIVYDDRRRYPQVRKVNNI